MYYIMMKTRDNKLIRLPDNYKSRIAANGRIKEIADAQTEAKTIYHRVANSIAIFNHKNDYIELWREFE